MITNLIDKSKWYLCLSKLTKQVLQTGFIVDYADGLRIRTGWEIRSRHWHWLQTLIENKTRSVAQMYQVVEFKNSWKPSNQGDLKNNKR